jgi:hypothetical protein
LEKAIGFLSTEEEDALNATAACTDAGDETTWRQADDERRNGVAKGPPIWHAGQEVEDAVVHEAAQHGVAPLTMDNSGASSPPLMYSARSSS